MKNQLTNVLNEITLQHESVGRVKGYAVEKDFGGEKRVAWVVTFNLNGKRVRKTFDSGATKKECETMLISYKDKSIRFPLHDVRFMEFMFITIERYAIPLWIEQARGLSKD